MRTAAWVLMGWLSLTAGIADPPPPPPEVHSFTLESLRGVPEVKLTPELVSRLETGPDKGLRVVYVPPPKGGWETPEDMVVTPSGKVFLWYTGTDRPIAITQVGYSGWVQTVDLERRLPREEVGPIYVREGPKPPRSGPFEVPPEAEVLVGLSQDQGWMTGRYHCLSCGPQVLGGPDGGSLQWEHFLRPEDAFGDRDLPNIGGWGYSFSLGANGHAYVDFCEQDTRDWKTAEFDSKGRFVGIVAAPALRDADGYAYGYKLKERALQIFDPQGVVRVKVVFPTDKGPGSPVQGPRQSIQSGTWAEIVGNPRTAGRYPLYDTLLVHFSHTGEPLEWLKWDNGELGRNCTREYSDKGAQGRVAVEGTVLRVGEPHYFAADGNMYCGGVERVEKEPGKPVFFYLIFRCALQSHSAPALTPAPAPVPGPH